MAEITTFGRILDGRLELCRLREYHKDIVGLRENSQFPVNRRMAH
jgi:hypothetical protein